MSASELSQLMREVGLSSSSSSSSSGSGEKIQVEHILILSLSEATDKLCKGVVLGFLELGRNLVQSCRILAMAGSISLVLWGTSHLIDSLRSRRSFGDSNSINGDNQK